MEKEIDPNIIKTTQVTLGKYLKKPVLSEKLLKKPPFRFLHDIITTVIKTTGFFDGLFEEHELISENVKDRESKINFLTKVIAVLGKTTGSQLSAKPSKIVAGQEADKTNEVLQCLALALDKKLSSVESVEAYKKDLKPVQNNENKKDIVKPVKKSTDLKSLTSKSNEKLLKTKKEIPEKLIHKSEKDKSNVKKIKQKDNNPSNKKATVLNKQPSTDKTQKESSKSKLDRELENEKSKAPFEKLETNNIVETDFISNEQNLDSIPNTDVDKQKINLQNSETIDDDNNLSSTKEVVAESSEAHPSTDIVNEIEKIRPEVHNINNIDDQNVQVTQMNQTKINTSNLDSNHDVKIVNKNVTSTSNSIPVDENTVRPSSMRPSSSRPGAPRIKQKHDNNINDNILLGKVNIIAENTTNDDEDTSIVIVDQTETLNTNIGHQEEGLSSTQKSNLVQQILDSQRELSNVAGKTEIEWQFGNQKARDTLNKEIEQLRFNIQSVSRIAGPLGKLLDHIQEDVEVMRQELFHWSKTYEDTSKELTKQKTENEESLYPFYGKLKKLNADIDERHEKINDIKTIVYKNSCRIEKLLVASGNM